MKFTAKALGLVLTAGLLVALSACSPQTDEGGDSAANAGGDASPPASAPSGGDAPEAPVNLGEFTTQDINGTSYTQDLFADYDLTLVNIFATWCSPCVEEIPGLEQLRTDMADQGVNVVGFVLDGADFNGNPLPDGVEAAKILAQRTGATYPFLLPDGTALNGRLSGVDAVPETFFVDKNGNIVGKTYVGARSREDWNAIVETELANLEEAAQ